MRVVDRLRLSTLIACCLVGAWGCSPRAPQTSDDQISPSVELKRPDHSSLGVKDWSTFKVMLERTTCLGRCSSYFVEVTGNGQVRYCGGANVKEAGVRTKTIPVASVRALAELLSNARFLELQDEYVGGADAPGQVLRLSFDGRTKKGVRVAWRIRWSAQKRQGYWSGDRRRSRHKRLGRKPQRQSSCGRLGALFQVGARGDHGSGPRPLVSVRSHRYL